MHNYYFDKEIAKETVNELVDRLQSQDDEINLWFSTDGGDCEAMEYLISVLNSFGDKITVTLCGQVHSAGLDLLTDYTGKLKISDRVDYFIFHKENRLLGITDKNHRKKLKKQSEEHNKIFAEKIKNKGLLTEKQLKRFNKGKDIHVYKKQILKWKIN
jgi:ATP-dependent protease ClpP protease subunit